VNDPAHVLSNEEFELISTPEAYAVLSLLDLDTFVYDVSWIASYLNLQKSDVETIIANLIKLELAEVSDGTLVSTKRRITSTDEIKSESIFNHHSKCLHQAMKIGESLPVESRYFSTITLPTNLELLDEAKVIIREFEEKLVALLGESYQKTDLVRFSIQLYPLTEIPK
jgi:uncharacterized protein (TIGR02147 family)